MSTLSDHQGELRDDRSQGAHSWRRKHQRGQKQQVRQIHTAHSFTVSADDTFDEMTYEYF